MHGKPPSKRHENIAIAALLLATVFWGCGFTWAKAAGEAVQQAAGLPPRAKFGPIFLLGWRFGLAALAWFIVFPAFWRGWTWRGLGWALLVGLVLGTALIVQHLGLDGTPEAVSAFLTSLTILFVPLLLMFVMRKPPRPVLWVGVLLATLGVWLMTGFQPRGFGLGEVQGLACAFLFSVFILVVNEASARESPWRQVGAQFAIVAAACFVTCAFVAGGPKNLHPAAMVHILWSRAVWLNLSLLTFFTTLLAFGLLTFFQPLIDPTRAALIYLAEPIFATVYAAVAAGHGTTLATLGGAGLILAANLLVEVLSSRNGSQKNQQVALVD